MGSSHQVLRFVISFPRAAPEIIFQSGPPGLTFLCHALKGDKFLRALCPCRLIFQDEPVEWDTPDLSQAEIEQKVKEYNGQINSNLFMSLVS